MEREIKFRAKPFDPSVHGFDFVYGGYYYEPITIIVTKDLEHIPVIHETVGQSAELDNINLYEGDRFHLGDPKITYVVEWFDCGLKGRQEGNNSFVGLVHCKNQIVKVGSIHDNKLVG